MNVPSDPAVQALIRQVGPLAQSGDAEQLIAVLREITRRAPDWLPGWMELAGRLGGLGRSDEAMAVLRKVMILVPAEVQPAGLATEIAWRANQREMALRLAGRILSLSPASFSALTIEMEAAVASGDTGRARAWARKLAVSTPAAPNPYRQLALALNAEWRGTSVERPLVWTCVLAPRWGEARLTLAGALFNEQRYLAAAEAAETAVRDGADARECHLLAGRAWMMADQPERAEPHLARAAELNPAKALEARIAGLTVTGRDFQRRG